MNDVLTIASAVAAVAVVVAVLVRLMLRMRVDAERARVELERMKLDLRALRADREALQARVPEPESHTPGGDQPAAIAGPGGSQIPPPEPPTALREVIAAGECVLFAGAGLTAQAGYPTFQRLVQAAIEHGERRYPDDTWSTLREQVQGGDVDVAVDILRARFGQEGLEDMFRAEVSRVVPRTAPTLSVLADIPFAGAITVDWTGMVIRTLTRPTTLAITPWRVAGALDALREGRHFILEAAGDVRGGSLVFAAQEMRDLIATNREYERFVVSLLTTRSLLFVGSSVRGLEQFLSSVDARAYGSRQHWALVSWAPDTPLQRERLMRRYGVELLPYSPTDGHEASTTRFVMRLHETVPTRRREVRKPARAERLEEIALRNIGPFEELRIELGDRTILLGDNGSGKSTVLRALAVALVGEAVTPQMALRLLKTTARSGEIALRTARDTYRTRLVRDGPRVRVESAGYSPVETGAWLALGFPPLRGVTTGNPRGPTASSEQGPCADDLLPLVGDGPDQRLDGLKQWVVNTALRAEDRSSSSMQDARLGQFFAILKDLTPGVEFEYAGIDRDTWDVRLNSPDGPLSLDLLSRGMTAVLGWIGVLLERIYEAYGDLDIPVEEQRILVLVDEIDVHLHPEWQQVLLPLLERHFPHLQIVATTHSPLIVGSAKPGEIRVLRREQGGIQPRRLDGPFAGWRSDQILTSPAFDMESARDRETATKQAEYRELMARGETPATNARAAELYRELERELPPAEDTAASREAVSLFREWLLQRLDDRPEDERKKIIGEAEVYLQRLYSGSDG